MIADTGNNRIVKLDRSGTVTLVYGSSATFNNPWGLAFDLSGSLYVADRNDDRVLKFGTPPLSGPSALALSSVASTPAKASSLVSGQTGGLVLRADHAAVVIPPLALSADLVVSVSSTNIRSSAEEASKSAQMKAKGLKGAASAVEYGPEGTQFLAPVTIVLPYDEALIESYAMNPEKLKVHFWNRAAGDWEALDSTVDPINRVISAQTRHFSLYQVLGPGSAAPAAAGPLAFGEVYVYPNPSRHGQRPTFHIEAGPADTIEIKIYDLSGKLMEQATVPGRPVVEYGWDASGAGSGVYLYVVTASQHGVGKISTKGKFAVIK
ncbi:MAG: T9SS type A sorting domain-containing protein [Elusimicrobia bacterium]|nr:T9SS type A sorting domain-containing protein [Elusimicrobiota bacterium]